jgi:broad specificity phosphatase PhoE
MHFARTGRFYFVRHGQTDANKQGLMCGRGWNIELNEAGIDQAKAARDLLNAENDLGTFYVSSMIRTRQTAQILNEHLNLPVSHLQDLEEWDVGEWDRRLWADVKDKFLSGVEPPGGESRSQFRDRVIAVLSQCAESVAPAILVSHGGVWQVIQQYLGIEPIKAENGVVIACTYQSGRWQARML